MKNGKKRLLCSLKIILASLFFCLGLFVLLAGSGGGIRSFCVPMAAISGLLTYLLLRRVHRVSARITAGMMLALIFVVNGVLVKNDFYRRENMLSVYAFVLAVLALLIVLLLRCVFWKKRDQRPNVMARLFRQRKPRNVSASETEAQERRQRRREERQAAKQERLRRRQQEREFKRRKKGLLQENAPKADSQSETHAGGSYEMIQEETPYRLANDERILAAVRAAVICLIFDNYVDMLFGNPLAFLQANNAIQAYAEAQ